MPTDTNLLVISYNEGEQDFYQNEVDGFYQEIINKSPSIIVLCTQKSKSQLALPSTSMINRIDNVKHFPHILGKLLIRQGIKESQFNNNKYKLLDKKDASFMIRGITENNNVRTRIYIKDNESSKINPQSIKFKLSSNTIGSVEKLSVNRQAICLNITINDKNFIIINTELASNNNANLGLHDRQKEFISLIKEFKLHKRFAEGYNIIFCGSLNFRLNPYRMINNEFRFKINEGQIYNNINYEKDLYKTLKNNIEIKINSNPNSLKSFNELIQYLTDLNKN